MEKGKTYWSEKAKNLRQGIAINPEFTDDLEMMTGDHSEVLLTEQKVEACDEAYNELLMLNMSLERIGEHINL